MRTREEIRRDGYLEKYTVNRVVIELLLDIRDLLALKDELTDNKEI